jgi:hypothetical protein
VLVGTFQSWAADHALSVRALYWPDGAKTRLAVQRTITAGFSSKRYKKGTSLDRNSVRSWSGVLERPRKRGCSDRTLPTCRAKHRAGKPNNRPSVLRIALFQSICGDTDFRRVKYWIIRLIGPRSRR